MVNKDFFVALDDLEKEKGIDKQFFIETLESALTSAYKKNFGEAKSASVKLNPEKNTIKVYSYKTVVEEVTDPDKEISLEDAKQIKKSYAVGDVISQEETPRDFGRIAAQIARQVVMQKLREAEFKNAMKEISDRQNEIVTCQVKRVENDIVYVEIPGNSMEGMLQKSDQIPGENYCTGDRIKVFVKNIREDNKVPFIQVSRSSNVFVKKLFELEVPEIKNGEIVIKNVSREPGFRTKISIYSTNPNLDAIGACVGNKGVRINEIINELNGEKIDIIEYSDNAFEYIARAMSPAKITAIYALEGSNHARVVVPDDKLSLAIGRGGQNVRLAGRLTGWKIDVRSESEAKQLDGGLMFENHFEPEEEKETPAVESSKTPKDEGADDDLLNPIE